MGHPSVKASIFLAEISILAAACAGCGRAVAPTAAFPKRVPGNESTIRSSLAGQDLPAGLGPGVGLFYPLQLGNHWGYEHVLSIVVIPDSGPPGPAFGLRDRRDRDLVCIEQRAGRSYVVERESFGGGLFTWVRYRQDGAGLYEADVDISLPPTCAGVAGRRTFDVKAAAGRGDEAWGTIAAKVADPVKQIAYRAAWTRIQARAATIRRALGAEPGAMPGAPVVGGVAPDEITRLQYPLHPGALWVIRGDPRVESTVEGTEVLDLAIGHVPGWRMRIESTFLGPEDHAHLWFGRSGFLKLVVHVEDVATDPNGDPIGRVISDESELLTELSLDGGRFAAR